MGVILEKKENCEGGVGERKKRKKTTKKSGKKGRGKREEKRNIRVKIGGNCPYFDSLLKNYLENFNSRGGEMLVSGHNTYPCSHQSG